MEKIKKLPSHIGNFANKNSNIIIALLISLLLFFTYKISNDTKHYEELHNLQMENIMMQNEVQLAIDLVEDQRDKMEEIEDALNLRTQQLNEAAAFINFLIEKLKSLGEWPLKEGPSPKGDHTRSEA